MNTPSASSIYSQGNYPRESQRQNEAREHLQRALGYLQTHDWSGALDAAGSAALAWRLWAPPYQVCALVFAHCGDAIAARHYRELAQALPCLGDNPVLPELPPMSPGQSALAGEDTAPLTLLFGGDVMLGRQMAGHVALKGISLPFGGIAAELARADLATVNLEAVSSTLGDFLDKNGRRPYYYHHHPRMLDVLVESGIQAVCTSNNHSMDFGPEALAQQYALLEDCGFAHFGSGRDDCEAARPVFVEIRGRVVALLGLETETPCMRAQPDRPGIHHAGVDEALLAMAGALAVARAHADVVIVSPHWGKNWQEQPSAAIRKLARDLIDLGVDAVLGHSAHILQGVERYRGRPIVYDMGTLLFDRVSQDRMRYSAVFLLSVGVDGIERLEITPVRLSSAQAMRAQGEDAEQIRILMEGFSRSLDPACVFARQGESLLLELEPEARGGLTPSRQPPQGVRRRADLRSPSPKWQVIKPNVVLDQAPANCQWRYPVRVNPHLEVLGARHADQVRPSRGFVCEVFFRADPPPPGRWEACVSALDQTGECVFRYKHPVAESLWPPDLWQRDQVIADRFVVRPAVDVPPGKYRLVWHLLDLENRLDMPVEGIHQRLIDGKVYLGEIDVSETAPSGIPGVSFPLPEAVIEDNDEGAETFQPPTWLGRAQAMREGWQCRVYLFRQHVVKVLKTPEETWQTVTRECKGNVAGSVAIVRGSIAPSLALLAQDRPPAGMVADFEEIGEGVYLQRRGQSLGDVIKRLLKSNDRTRIEDLLTRIVDLVLELWRYGVSETSWKFTTNFGITVDGQVVLIDCLELTEDREFVLGQVQVRRWLRKNRWLLEKLPAEMAESFSRQAAERLTPAALLQVWGEKLPPPAAGSGRERTPQ